MSEKIQRAKIKDLLATLPMRDLPLIGPKAKTAEIITCLQRHRHCRVLYVVDEEKRLLGFISLGDLVRHLFAPSHEVGLLVRHALSLITVERAEDIMCRHPLTTDPTEEVGQVIKKMVRDNIKEIAVLDEARRIIADLTLFDLLPSNL